MKVAIVGGTGFVGSYLVDALLSAGHEPQLLVRSGSEKKVKHHDKCQIYIGDVQSESALVALLKNADAVIYNIGILREFPTQGITFRGLQYECATHVIDKAKELGIKRFLLMSANGIKPDGTEYQKTKYAAEDYLQASGLDWTIFRPSVIFGNPHGHFEFASSLKQQIIESPLPAPLFYSGIIPVDAGRFEMSPVYVGDVASAFVQSLDQKDTFSKIYPLCGPDTVSWKRILTTIANVCGVKKMMMPSPVIGVSILAAFFERFYWFPVTRDQLTMLLEGNTCDSQEIFEYFQITPIGFSEDNLAYLKDAPVNF